MECGSAEHLDEQREHERGGDLTHAEGAELFEWVNDTSFPSSREDLLRHAEHRHAPDEVLELLHSLPERQYHTIGQATEALGLSMEKRRW
ncbi:DUF2795 domain-containing protein [Nonomuraea sp. NPDC050022]|uniref:DUF2795 domain-containing protein n=1 Tax=Nonomuraea sp. NPDC050022 TaxID=3364358 RepID=UPI003793B9B8